MNLPTNISAVLPLVFQRMIRHVVDEAELPGENQTTGPRRLSLGSLEVPPEWTDARRAEDGRIASLDASTGMKEAMAFANLAREKSVPHLVLEQTGGLYGDVSTLYLFPGPKTLSAMESARSLQEYHLCCAYGYGPSGRTVDECQWLSGRGFWMSENISVHTGAGQGALRLRNERDWTFGVALRLLTLLEEISLDLSSGFWESERRPDCDYSKKAAYLPC